MSPCFTSPNHDRYFWSTRWLIRWCPIAPSHGTFTNPWYGPPMAQLHWFIYSTCDRNMEFLSEMMAMLMAMLTAGPGLDPTNHKKSMHRQSHCVFALRWRCQVSGVDCDPHGQNFSFAAALAESFLQAGEGLKHWAQRPSICRQQAWLSPGSICRDVYPLCLKHPSSYWHQQKHQKP